MNQPLVSIITVSFNGEQTIRQTIESVLAQTYTNYEHIFIDGGSADSTISIIESYRDNYLGRQNIFVEKDEGIYDAMNKGIARAAGEIIGIINSDDWYADTALEQVVQEYKKATNKYVVITGDLVRTTITGITLFTQTHSMDSLKRINKGMPLQHPAVFLSKEVYSLIGTFDLRFKFIADYDLIWRCYLHDKVAFSFTYDVVSFMREGGASDTPSFKNIWRRTSERFFMRNQYMNPIHNTWLCAEFFIMEWTKQLIKRVIPKGLKKKYYDFKHPVRENN